MTQIYFLNMIREIEEDIPRNFSKDEGDLILDILCLVTGKLTSGIIYHTMLHKLHDCE